MHRGWVAFGLYKALLVYHPLQPNAIAEPKSRPNAEYIYGVIENYKGAHLQYHRVYYIAHRHSLEAISAERADGFQRVPMNDIC